MTRFADYPWTALVAVMLCVAAMGRSSMARQDVVQQAEQDTDGTRTLRNPGTGRRQISILTPERVTGKDIERWSEQLLLSEGQQAYFQTLFDAHTETDRELRRKLFDPIRRWSASLSDVLHLANTEIDVAKEIDGLLQQVGDAVEQVIQNESVTLFDPLVPVLSEEQVALLRTVANRRKRDAYSIHVVFLPAAKVDVSELYLALIEAEVDLQVTDQDAFESVLAAYELTRTSKIQSLYRRSIERMGKATLARAHIASGVQPDLNQSRYGRLGDAIARTELALARTNELYLPMLREHLTPTSAAIVTSHYREIAQPQLFPNECDIESIINMALDIPHLTDVQRDELQGIRESAEFRFEVVHDRMRATNREWLLQFVRTLSMAREDESEYIVAMDRAQAERVQIAEDSLELLISILDGELPQDLQSEMVEFVTHIRSLEPVMRDLYYYPAGIQGLPERGAPLWERRRQGDG